VAEKPIVPTQLSSEKPPVMSATLPSSLQPPKLAASPKPIAKKAPPVQQHTETVVVLKVEEPAPPKPKSKDRAPKKLPTIKPPVAVEVKNDVEVEKSPRIRPKK
jgi:hypothetical protein